MNEGPLARRLIGTSICLTACFSATIIRVFRRYLKKESEAVPQYLRTHLDIVLKTTLETIVTVSYFNSHMLALKTS